MVWNTAELCRVEYAAGVTIEYAPAVLEEIRRLAVDGLIAFAHGGLEIGGVLYGHREGHRMTINASAALDCEHALGPGFVLSDRDRAAMASLLDAPSGLETIGWYRTHTRRGLDLDASDRALFEQYFGDQKSVGLVLKPSHWGTSTAVFYVQEDTGEVLPSVSGEFTLQPPARRPAEPVSAETGSGESEAVESEAVETAVVESQPAPETETPLAFEIPRSAELEAADEGSERQGWRTAVTAAVVAIAGAAVFLWPRHSPKLELRVSAISPGQVRIEWNRDSLPVIEGGSGILQIRDGDSDRIVALDANQLRASSVIYLEKSSHLMVKLRVEPRRSGASPAEESAEVGRPEEPPVTAQVDSADRSGKLGPPEQVETAAARQTREVKTRRKPVTERAPVPASQKEFRPMFAAPKGAPARVAALPAAPVVLPAAPPAPAPGNLQGRLPDLFSTAQPPPKPAPALAAPSYAGSRSGRMIWTGNLGHRGVIEMEGARASIGSLSGSLAGVPANYHVLPAEFTRNGITVYTADGAAHGRTEPPSKSNGWNVVHFVYDPVRAAELVVLESPSPLNNFNRLVVRNDARPCAVVVIDWAVRPDVR